MSTHEDTLEGAARVSAEAVAEYLRSHPEFFNQQPELVAELQIPHASGDAISLYERQLAALREQNEKLQRRLHELIEIARQNEELARRMHHLALTLMDATEPREIFATLYENLRRNFRADRVAVRLFADPAFIDVPAGPEFAGRKRPEVVLFESMIRNRTPLCGPLKKQQQVYLFGDDGERVASAVMVPLHGAEWGGVMVIGSHDPQRYQPGMGVELLANLGEVLSFIIKPWIVVR
jgi:hypothetical protein